MRSLALHPRRGFTLTELLVAITVLIAVLLAAGKIFSTTSKVTSLGEANGDVLQEVIAIERQMRADLSRLSREGPFMIRNAAVRNDVRGPGAPLLDARRDPDAIIRSDQLVFLRSGAETPKSSRIGSRGRNRGSGFVSRIYYGHAFQMADASDPFFEGASPANTVGVDPSEWRWPWQEGEIPVQETQYDFANAFGTDMYSADDDGVRVIPAIPATRWLMVRQPVVLVDDDGPQAPLERNSRTVYLSDDSGTGSNGAILAARTVFLNHPVLGFEPTVMQGRVDAAASMPDELRRFIQFLDPLDATAVRPWRQGPGTPVGNGGAQYILLNNQMLYVPRAERQAPSMHRMDQALTQNVIGSAVSSIRIEWTWRTGVGEVLADDGSVLWTGFQIAPDVRTDVPWFGLDDSGYPADQRLGVRPLSYEGIGLGYLSGETVFPDNVERFIPADDTDPQIYTAIFGYNEDQPLETFDSDGDGIREPVETLGYTPWPTAIRVTLTVHDPGTRLARGREVQFVIDLPPRGS